MGWFRSRARIGGWLALVALTLQLVLTFGHVHLDHAAPLAPASTLAAAGSSSDPVAPTAPDGAADDYCVICALVHLAGSLTLSDAPALPVPIAFDRPRPPSAVSTELTASPFTLQRARAPPIA
jgi:DUF2946 family protein